MGRTEHLRENGLVPVDESSNDELPPAAGRCRRVEHASVIESLVDKIPPCLQRSRNRSQFLQEMKDGLVNIKWPEWT
jgi:hypothetical protein